MCKNDGFTPQWTAHDTPSKYYHSFAGQFEYMLMRFFSSEMNRIARQTPLFWSGAGNAIELYIIHPSYSPFVNNEWSPEGKRRQITMWKMDDVPEGQEDTVDENFIPIALKKS